MRQDTVALHGFGKMFTQLWREQSDSVNKIRSFIVHRGGSVDTPGHIVSHIIFIKQLFNIWRKKKKGLGNGVF